MNGICTLGNDRVFDQVIALLNSIEARYGSAMPVCIYPYDQHTERLAAAIQHRPQVQLYRDTTSIKRWDGFVRQIWDAHPTARQRWGSADPNYYHRVGTHRRFCAFDGPFERFLYMDADTLLLDTVEPIFQALDQHDWVVYDFQYKDPTHVYEVNSPKLHQVFPAERIASEIFCSGFYASKRGLFDQHTREQLLETLQISDAEILYPMAPDQTILNYMVMKSELSSLNLALSWPEHQRTGNSVTSSHFEPHGQLLYDHGKPLTYLHYIGISSSLFQQVCTGENLDFPYRDLFLHYRYLHNPQDCPQFSGKPKRYQPSTSTSLPQRLWRKLRLAHQ